MLFGNFAACLIMALASGYRGVIAGLSPALVIGMAGFGSSMDAQGDVLFVTVSAALILTPVVTGVSCLWLWGPGVAYGIALYLAMKRWGNALIVPISVALAVGGYHLALAGLGISGDDARGMGLLLTSTADGNLWPALSAADILRVEWVALAGQIPNMLALITVAFICVIMNIAGLEVATNEELDWNREFKACGLASTLAGVGGGTVATIVVPASLRSKLFGAATRLTVIVAALVVGIALFVGDGVLELVPSPWWAGYWCSPVSVCSTKAW